MTDSSAGRPKPRILFVEDEARLREHLASVLVDEFLIDTAADGHEALTAVQRHRPDLVVTDLVMPGMDGIALIQALRATPSTSTIPILMISGHAADEVQLRGFEFGADAYLSKPYTEKQLRVRIRALLQVVRLRNESARTEERERAEHEALVERAALLESITDPFYAVDREWRVTYANQLALDYFGRSRDQLIGKIIWEEFPAGKESVVEQRYRRVMQTQRAESFETRSPLTGRWVEVHVYPTPKGLAINFRDVTERNRDRQALLDSEERFRQLADSIPQLAWMVRPNGEAFWFNTRWYEYTGTSFEQVSGDGWKQVHDQAVLPEVLESFEHSLRSGEAFEMVFPIRAADGSFRRFLTQMVPLRDRNGEVTLWFGTNTDVEEQSRRTDMFRTMADAAPVLVWIADENKSCNWFNKQWLEYTGRALEQEVGFGWSEGVHPEDRQRCLHTFRSNFDARRPFTTEYRLRRHDGAYGWLLGTGVPLFGGQRGTFSGYIGTCIDITDRKRAEDSYKQSEERYRAFLANTSEAIWRYELDPPLDLSLSIDDQIRYVYDNGVLAELNDAMARMYGYERAEDLVGAPLAKTLPPDESALEYLRSIAAAGYSLTDIESVERDRDGHVRHFSNSLVPVIKDGKLLRAWGTQRDVTDRKRAEQALRDDERRKDEFLAILAHELRNPLAPIRTGLQILRRQGITDSAAGLTLTMMDRQMTHLVRLVDDLLDIGRVNSGRLQLKLQTVLVTEALEAATESMRDVIDADKHRLVIDGGPERLYVHADPNRLVQIFSNLLSNAAKYSDPGSSIVVTLEQQSGQVVITVRDTGIGIPSSELEHVFDMFSQVRAHQSRASGGLGIGLALVRTLVEMHAGTVSAVSEGPGKGSTFIVRLPLVDAADAEQSPSSDELPAVDIRSTRILVVDDNADAAASLAALLAAEGAEVKTAADGEEAIEVTAKFSPRAIFMDLGMPKLDGVEATRRIRALPRGNEIFIVALTGWGQPADRERTHAAGFNQHLVKPISSNELLAALHEFEKTNTA